MIDLHFALMLLSYLLSRGGGGGSSSGGGGGGGGSSSGSSYSSGGSSGGSDGPWWLMLIFWGSLIFFMILVIRSNRKKHFPNSIVPKGFAKVGDKSSGQLKTYAKRVEQVFGIFQKGWSEFDIGSIQKIASLEYTKRMTLELNVLKNYQRQNQMENAKLLDTHIKPNESGFIARVHAQATDKLIDVSSNKTLFTDDSAWVEYWHFIHIGSKFVLDNITQETEDKSKIDPKIAEFAQSNDFYYDPDFGWLMMPSRGAIFSEVGFGKADINNHVIGFYRDKIVEFYTYEPRAGSNIAPFVVAQAILPKRYSNILVVMKHMYSYKPKDLRKIEMEDPDFNQKFAIWADSRDATASFELLATNFMTRIYDLETEINIEVVDNVLYFYAKDKSADYTQLLQILSWAFDEMKL